MKKSNFIEWCYRSFKKKFFLILIILQVCFTGTYAEGTDIRVNPSDDAVIQQGITGTVIDESTKEALAGVAVRVKGTQTGALTGPDGKYSLPTADRAATLIFSFVGYETVEIEVAGKAVVDVALASSIEGLEEVVVIGYGQQKKETLTGSVAQIQNEQLQATKTPSVAGAIQGKVVGVMIRQQTSEPGVFNSNISIRGFGAPLLVIDGVVRDDMADFERLNPEDIETISVLKDASASIYGMNAANGVMIVTTKKGVAGKTKFSLSTVHTAKQPTTSVFQTLGDAYTVKYIQNEMARNSKLPQPTNDSLLALWKAGTARGYTDYDWFNNMTRDWVTSNEATFSARGGNENITFFSSFGFMDDNGYFKINDLEKYKKYTFRTNIEAKVAKGLTAKLNFYGRYEDQIQPPQDNGVFWIFKRMVISDRGVGPYTIDDPTKLSKVPIENTNVLAELTRDIAGYDQNLKFQYQTTLDLNYDVPFVKGLSVGLLGAYDGFIGERRLLKKTYQLYNYESGDKEGTPGLNNFRNTINLDVNKTANLKFAYRTRIAQNHNVAATLIGEVKTSNSNDVNGYRQYDAFYTKDVLNQASATNQTTGGNRSEEAYASVLGRFNYDFKSKYLLDLSFRQDGTYRYAPGKRWAFFPAAQAGWRIGQEAFIKDNLPIISDLKIRGSWGKSGYNTGNAYQWIEAYSLSNVAGGYIFNDGVVTVGAVPPGIVNDWLTWVSTVTTDFGFDLQLWKGKFGFTFDYFERLEKGILATRTSTLPNTFGANFTQENLDSRKVKGMEFSASHRNVIGKFSYGLNANFTISRQFGLHREANPYSSSWDHWRSGSNEEGRITGRQLRYERDGVFASLEEIETAILQMDGGFRDNYAMGNSKTLPGMQKIVDVNGDGRISGEDQTYNAFGGGGNPPAQFGLNMDFHYMNFDLIAGFQGATMFTMSKSSDDQWGYTIKQPTIWEKYLDRWHTANVTDNPFDPATVWIPGKWEPLTADATGTARGLQTDKWRINGTYLRLKNVELGYNLPTKFASKVGLEGVRAFVNCYNIFTIVNEELKDMDPERAEGLYGTNNTYPLMRTYNLGLEIKF